MLQGFYMATPAVDVYLDWGLISTFPAYLLGCMLLTHRAWAMLFIGGHVHLILIGA